MIETRRSAPLFVSTFLLPVRCPQTTKENYGYVHWFVFITLSFLLSGCLEEFEPETNSFESILVVEAVITDEVKPQEILLNQTFRFEEQGPRPEQNAIVQIVEDGATNYTFTEVEPGRYVSNENFGATSGIDYELVINTMDGTTYRSDAASLSGANASLDDLDIVKTMNRDKVDGVSLRVNSFNASDNSGYYRLEYEETYNIIAPRWTLSDAVYVNGGLVFQQRTEEQRTCYATKVSNSSILVNTNVLEENSISGFQVRFIARDDFIIAHRYSLLVRLFSVSRSAFSYYRTLDENSGTEGIFSENQPGFIEGNISVENNDFKKVIGYFDVSSVTTKRIFFNHEEIYPNNFPANFPINCEPFSVDYDGLIYGVRNRTLQYLYTEFKEETTDEPSLPYLVVPRACGDCTVLGSNVVPAFWED